MTAIRKDITIHVMYDVTIITYLDSRSCILDLNSSNVIITTVLLVVACKAIEKISLKYS